MGTEAIRVKVPLTSDERSALSEHATRHHRTLSGQLAVIVTEWLTREERRERIRESNRGAA